MKLSNLFRRGTQPDDPLPPYAAATGNSVTPREAPPPPWDRDFSKPPGPRGTKDDAGRRIAPAQGRTTYQGKSVNEDDWKWTAEGESATMRYDLPEARIEAVCVPDVLTGKWTPGIRAATGEEMERGDPAIIVKGFYRTSQWDEGNGERTIEIEGRPHDSLEQAAAAAERQMGKLTEFLRGKRAARLQAESRPQEMKAERDRFAAGIRTPPAPEPDKISWPLYITLRILGMKGGSWAMLGLAAAAGVMGTFTLPGGSPIKIMNWIGLALMTMGVILRSEPRPELHKDHPRNIYVRRYREN